jgi:hypothetical protein
MIEMIKSLKIVIMKIESFPTVYLLSLRGSSIMKINRANSLSVSHMNFVRLIIGAHHSEEDTRHENL